MSILRTLLFVPGCRPEMLAKAASLAPDGLILDLEDSVPDAEKASARAAVAAAIPALAHPRRTTWVRVNSTYTGLTKDDCRAVALAGLTGILLPKADSAEIIRYADALLRDAEARNGLDLGAVKVIAGIESAAALLHAEAISLASERIVALALGAEDYAADLRVERTPAGDEIGYARSVVGVVARATGRAALDAVYPYVHDIEGLVRDARNARQAGFEGKCLIHPEQIEPVQAVFAPSESQVATAKRIVEAYARACAAGQGAVLVDGTMVDAPVAKRAQALLDLAGASEPADGVPG
jgi:citrate lyase subunit beta/citryl-CoA lyase